MSNLTFSPGQDASSAQENTATKTTETKTAIVPTRRANSPVELARQVPNDVGYVLQQFVRLAGAQHRMSAEEIAYHNRAHQPFKRAS